MKRRYKIALWSLIPLLFVGILGVGLFSPHTQAARAVGTGQPTPCDQDGHNHRTTDDFGFGLDAWKCQTDPLLRNSNGCLKARLAPLLNAQYKRCFPFSSPDALEIVCQTSQGDNVGGSTFWDEIATVGLDAQQTPVLLFVSDYFMSTSHYNAPSPPIKDCGKLPGTGKYPSAQ